MDSYDIYIGYHKCSVILLKYISSTCSSYSAKYTSKDQDQGQFLRFSLSPPRQSVTTVTHNHNYSINEPREMQWKKDDNSN